MNFKTTYVLFGLLAVVLIGFGVALWMEPVPKSGDKVLFPSARDPKTGETKIKAEDFDAVEIDRSGSTKEKLVFTRDSGTKRWTVNGMRADKLAVNNLISQVLGAEKAESDPMRSLEEWGLQDPQAVVTLKRGDKEPLTLKVGHVSPGETDAVVYVISSDKPKDAVAVRKTGIANVLKDLASFRERELFTGAPTDIQSVSLADGTNPTIELVKNRDNNWVFEKPFKDTAETAVAGVPEEGKAPSNVQALLNELTGLIVEGEDFEKDDVSDAVLARDYHFGAKSPVLTITVQRREESGTTTDVVLRVATSEKDKKDKYFAVLEVKGSPNNVVRLAAKKFTPLTELLKKPAIMRDRHLVKTDGLHRPDAIRVRNESGKFELYRSGETWRMFRDDGEVTIDPRTVPLLISQLTEVNIEEFLSAEKFPEASLGVDKEADARAVVEVWIDGIAEEKKEPAKEGDKKTKPKLKDDKKPTKLIFGKANTGPEKTVAVKRVTEGDKGSLLWVRNAVYDSVAKRPLDYMDKQLPKYNEVDALAGVTKVELTRPGSDGKSERWVVKKEVVKDETLWKIQEPESLKGRNADPFVIQGFLRRLNALTAASLETEKASSDALENNYGLGKAAATRIVITTEKKVDDKDKVETFEYQFGRSKDESFQYAKQAWRDMVFTVEKKKETGGIVSDLESKDLLDPTVLTFKQEDVKSIKIVGWYNLTESPTTIELEASGDKWTVKTPPMKVAKVVEVSGLVNTLSSLRAERFAAHNVKEPDPSYEFEVRKNALHITITLKDEKAKPIELKIGKLDGDKGYFATSTSAPGDIFVVGKLAFEEARKRPAYFFTGQ